MLDAFSHQKHFQSSMALVLDALVVPRTETLAVYWLQLTEQSAMLIHPLACSVTEHPPEGLDILVSLILFMKHVITNTTLLAFCVTKLRLLIAWVMRFFCRNWNCTGWQELSYIGLGLTDMIEDSEYPETAQQPIAFSQSGSQYSVEFLEVLSWV